MIPKNHEGNGQFPDKRIVRFPFTVLYNLENMEINSILLAFLLTMIAGLSTGVGSLIAFFAKRTNTKFLSAALGFSAGVMIYISFMELMPEALGMLSENFSPRMSNIYMLIAFFSGTSFIALIDFLIPEDENPHEIHRVEELSGQQRLHRTGILMALAISIHNFPEGLATFASALGNIDIAIPCFPVWPSREAHSSDSCFCYLFGLPRFTRFYWHSYRVLWCSFHSMSCCREPKNTVIITTA